MNDYQKVALMAGVGIIVLMILIPPWTAVPRGMGNDVGPEPIGYGTIAHPPEIEIKVTKGALGYVYRNPTHTSPQIAVRQLGLQIFAVAVFTGAVIAVLHDGRKKPRLHHENKGK